MQGQNTGLEVSTSKKSTKKTKSKLNKPLTNDERKTRPAIIATSVTNHWLREYKVGQSKIEKGIIDFVIRFHGLYLVN